MKRGLPSVYFGIIVGLSLGFVLCNVVHAEQICPSTLDVEAERCRKEVYRAWHDGILQYDYDPGPYRPNTLGPYEGDLFEKQANCYTQMEAAMRAMDEFVPPTDVFMMALNMTKTKDHDVALASFIARSTLATKQWERAKACWRKP